MSMRSRLAGFAARGRGAASSVAGGAPAARSTLNRAKDSRMARYVVEHPFKSSIGGAMGLGGLSYMSGRTRRGPGASKMPGRPTGNYKY